MSENIRRFSSRRERLDHVFLAEKLKNAKSYDRIAGYFRSSIFELVAGIDFPGNPASRDEAPLRAGKILGRLFRESGGRPIPVDGFTVTRAEVATYVPGRGEEKHKNYTILRQ
jgi:hypothetical protein